MHVKLEKKKSSVIQYKVPGKGAKKAEREKKNMERRQQATHPKNFSDFRKLMLQRLNEFTGTPIHEKFKKDHLASGHKPDKKDVLIATLRGIAASTIVWGLENNAKKEVKNWIENVSESAYKYNDENQLWERVDGNEVESLNIYALSTIKDGVLKESNKYIGICCDVDKMGLPLIYHCNY